MVVRYVYVSASEEITAVDIEPKALHIVAVVLLRLRTLYHYVVVQWFKS